MGSTPIMTRGSHRGAKRRRKPRHLDLNAEKSQTKNRANNWRGERVCGETICKGNLAMILSSETQTVTRPLLEEVEEQEFDLDSDWNVVLLDDDHHTYDYVIELLGDVFGYDELQAYGFAIEVDMKKRVTVW
ncbi:ATP-dependent Clp protease adaptor ClpS, partial [bacterium]